MSHAGAIEILFTIFWDVNSTGLALVALDSDLGGRDPFEKGSSSPPSPQTLLDGNRFAVARVFLTISTDVFCLEMNHYLFFGKMC